jgi:hypothetical protein
LTSTAWGTRRTGPDWGELSSAIICVSQYINSDFLKSLDDPEFFDPSATYKSPFNSHALLNGDATLTNSPFASIPAASTSISRAEAPTGSTSALADTAAAPQEAHLNLKPADKNDRYLLAAADQRDGSRDVRLARVIHAKFEAGLLKPYDYVSGYKRLNRWMESHVRRFPMLRCDSTSNLPQMSTVSRQRTLKTLSEFRPAFRAIASSLSDLDLVFIEEAFERLLLDYGMLPPYLGEC